MTIYIVTDSTCDLPKQAIEKYNITVIPAFINVGDKSYSDGTDLTREDFYTNIESYHPHPTTAAPPPGVFTEAYKKLAAEGATAIISLHVSAELSAFLNAARLGTEAFESHIDVHLIDSRTISMGLGLVVLATAQAVAAGHDLADVIAVTQSAIERTVVYACADTLEFLRRSGRVGFATAGLGSLLKIKPILRVQAGTATSFDRVRTRKKIQPRLIRLIRELGVLEAFAVVYSRDYDRAVDLWAEVREIVSAETHNEPITQIGPAIGAHIGPGAVGIACLRAVTTTD